MEIAKDISVKDLLMKIMPEKTSSELTNSNAATELKGTKLTMTVDVSGDAYSYIVTNGEKVEVKEGAIESPVVLLNVEMSDIEKMIANQELDMLMGITSDLNKSKYNAIKNLKGSFKAELTNDDGSSYGINVTFNGAQSPRSLFRMKTSDSTALMKKEQNPVNLFMSGAMQIEGDMAFAMATQPLFT